jgi:hypothetical protein
MANTIGPCAGSRLSGCRQTAGNRAATLATAEELLRRARPLPPHDEMVIEDTGEGEGAAFVAAVDS